MLRGILEAVAAKAHTSYFNDHGVILLGLRANRPYLNPIENLRHDYTCGF